MKSAFFYIRLATVLLSSSALLTAEDISNFDDSQSRWNLILGQEYPGAKAELDVREDLSGSHKGAGYGIVAYDFSAGGAYVGIDTATAAITEESPVFSFWAKSSNRVRLKIRIVDSADQTFDIEEVLDSDEWKNIQVDTSMAERFVVFGGSGEKVFQYPSKAVFIGLTKAYEPTGELYLDTVKSLKSGDEG